MTSTNQPTEQARRATLQEHALFLASPKFDRCRSIRKSDTLL